MLSAIQSANTATDLQQSTSCSAAHIKRRRCCLAAQYDDGCNALIVRLLDVLQRFRPITVEKPKVLLPLVNVPLLEYTLEWLAMNNVEEVGGCTTRLGISLPYIHR